MYDREIGEPARKKPASVRAAPVRESTPAGRGEVLQPAVLSSGRVLPGFVRAQRPHSDVFRRWFPPPVVPPDYVPVHRFLKPVIARLFLFHCPLASPFTCACAQCPRRSGTT